jgi:hypothetical protein
MSSQRARGARARLRAVGCAAKAAHHRILQHRHVGEGLDDLEGPADARPADLIGPQAVDRPALEADRAAVGRHRAGDQVEERRLAGAVRPDQRDDLALRDRERARETAFRPRKLFDTSTTSSNGAVAAVPAAALQASASSSGAAGHRNLSDCDRRPDAAA